jgi:predicted nucleic-acid-binding Zn-ribbon protein
MSDKPCKNCGSTDLYVKEVGARGAQGPDLLPIYIWTLTGAKFEIHVCGSCGLTEWFVPERYLAKVKEKFSRA